MWQEMKGELPCLDASSGCIQQLQSKAAGENPLLQEIDTRIEEIGEKIDEAKSRNQQSVKLSILSPALQVFLAPQQPSDPKQPAKPNPIGRILSLITNPVNIVNELIAAVGVPLLQGVTGGNADAQGRAIAISDLQIKAAQLTRDRAELANKIKEQAALAVLDFDTKKRSFQATLLEVKLKNQQTQIVQLEFRLGQHDSIAMLNQENNLNSANLDAFRQWGELKAQVERIKLLVLGTTED